MFLLINIDAIQESLVWLALSLRVGAQAGFPAVLGVRLFIFLPTRAGSLGWLFTTIFELPWTASIEAELSKFDQLAL